MRGLWLAVALAGRLGAQTIGADMAKLNGVYAQQNQSAWCWAACVQMIFQYYGFSLGQRAIVERAYGDYAGGGVRNHGGTVADITKSLAGGGADERGTPYQSMVQFWAHAPTPQVLRWELGARHPILIACAPPPRYAYLGTGHAVLIVAGDFTEDASGYPEFTTLTVRDPSPYVRNGADPGMVVYPARELLKRIQCYWTVKVIPGASAPPAR